MKPYNIEGIALNRCPMRFIDERSTAMIEVFMPYKKGFLPNEGGWLDQTVRFSRSMSLIEDCSAKLQEEKEHSK